MHAAAVRLRSAGGTQFIRSIARNAFVDVIVAVQSAHVDKYLLATAT